MSIISTLKIIEAINYYQNLGYQLIDVPMCIDLDVSNHTKPKESMDLYHTKDKVYIGSAEQSFIQMHKDGNLKNGLYMALTPCNRDELVLDDFHYKMFLKLELISIGQSNSLKMANQSKKFFNKYIDVYLEDTNESIKSIDINSTLLNKEVGSYGVRNMINGTIYTYGTGIAEPRLSVIEGLIKDGLF